MKWKFSIFFISLWESLCFDLATQHVITWRYSLYNKLRDRSFILPLATCWCYRFHIYVCKNNTLLKITLIEIKIEGFQKCKVHLCTLKGFKTAAHQSWHILRVVLESNLGQQNRYGLQGPGSIPWWRKVCTNFDELQFWSPLRYRDVLYSFEKFQYLSKWF